MIHLPLLIVLILLDPKSIKSFNLPKNFEINRTKNLSLTPKELTTYKDTILSPIESMFIKITHKKYLKQVGYSSLKNKGNAQVTELEIPPDYRFNTGDEIIVYITGSIENSIPAKVDKSGMIFIPGLGTINVAGLTLSEIEERLNTLARKKWANVKITISPGKIHGIKVYLTGEVQNPGAYVLRSHSTFLDLIFLAQGILKTGSLRNIHVIHTDGTISFIDLYPYIFGGKSKPFHLHNGDVVVVPTLKNIVGIDGCVHIKGIYEIKEDGTSLEKMLKWAGILPFSQKRVEIYRIEEDSIRIFSVPREKFNEVLLKSGDYIFVPYAKFNLGGYVYIKGNVKKEGYYTYQKGMKLSTLIKKAGGFMHPPYKELLIFRKDTMTYDVLTANLDDTSEFVLQDGDSVIVFDLNITKGIEPVTINGYVRKPGYILWGKKLSVKKAVLSAIPKEDADLEGITVYSQKTGKILKVSKNNWDSFFLYPGDVIYVPQDTLKQNKIQVFVKGEIRYPGVYIIKKGSRVKDLIKIAGGLKDDAYRDGIYIKRKDITHGKGASLTNTILFNLALREDTFPNLSDYMTKIIKERFENTIPGDMHMILRDGDTIIIPQYTPYVYITGAVIKPYTALYNPHQTICDILKHAPLYPQANVKRAFAISVNGKIHNGRIKPGDIIFVPFKKSHRESLIKYLGTVTTIIYQIILSVFVIHQMSK